jgi:hypothetical protein
VTVEAPAAIVAWLSALVDARGIEKRCRFPLRNKRTRQKEARPLFARSLLVRRLLHGLGTREQALVCLFLDAPNPCGDGGDANRWRVSNTPQPSNVLLRDAHVDHVLK